MQEAIRIVTLCILLLLAQNSFDQIIYTQVSNSNIYELLDELANDKIISLNTTIKPYSKRLIYEKLKEAYENEIELNIRQLEEVEYYLKEYKFVNKSTKNPYSGKAPLNIFNDTSDFATSINPFGFYYKDSLFSFTMKPIWGVKYWSNDSGIVTHTWGGAEIQAAVGEHLAFYASLRDNRITNVLNQPEFLTDMKGGSHQLGKAGRLGSDFNEMIGGITYSWKWGNIGVIKDNLIWGDSYHGSNILSGRTPSFPLIKLHLHPVKWLDFNYFHGWLVSEVIDSSRSYITSTGDNRLVFRNKYMAANSFTLIPVNGLNITIGNSIIYSDIDFNPGYIIPFLFYKSVDHTLNHNIDNQNSQMFGNVSIRLIKHLHLYSSLFIDEFQFARIKNDTTHNFFSFKLGSKLSNWPVRNVSITGEFTHTNPLTFKHRVPTLTFESNKYNLGHYLGDNSREIYAQILVKPIRRCNISLSYLYAKRGNNYQYIEPPGIDIAANPILKDITWDNESIKFKVSYEFLNNSYLSLEYLYSNISGYSVDGEIAQYYLDLFSPAYFHGKQNTLSVGLNFGF